jgi:hypothetical protein
MEAGIEPFAELRSTIGMMQIDDNVSGIEEHDQVLRKVGDPVNAKVRIVQEDRACLRDGKRCWDDGKINIGPDPAAHRHPRCRGCPRSPAR